MNYFVKFKIKRFFINLFQILKELFIKRNIGEKSILGFNVHVLGWNNIKIGSNTIIGDNSWLNVNDRKKDTIGIDIGNNCYISKNNVISSSKKLIIKDFYMSNINVHLLGSNHIISNPMKPYIQTGATKEDTLYIGTNVWMGASSCVLGNVTVGHGSIIGAGSIVTKDIPPFSIAVGNPAKIIKRFSFKLNKWVSINEYDENEIYPDEDKYSKELAKSYKPLPPQIAGKIAGDI